MFEGVAVAMVTPFRDGEIDFEALDRLVDHLLDGGIDGIVPVGCTGEAAVLSPSERLQVIQRVQKRTRGRAYILPGTGTNTTASTIERTREARELGVDGAMLITPYYNKPTPAGLLAHYQTVADAVDIPIVLYNVPGRTGVSLTVPTVIRLAKHPRIVAIKEASGSLEAISEIAHAGTITLLSGDDGLTLPILAVGGQGVVSVLGNLFPRAMVSMVKAARSNDLETARRYHLALGPLFKALFIESNPGPIKYLLSQEGLIKDEFRLPLVPIREDNREGLREVAERVRRAIEGLDQEVRS
ncbi:MAG: 4-hydroxy-tetrahydrodipicolinate synthase [Candidatus Eisenbacteria bacterium]|uniref:4-hydroxy-tetrahydrodipicolinate synthase n=1 Tax=Eiseniibacteriota bacterium TaxID=2212470 RepID=A0A948W5R3_UNCEI|nr:4-hydroxy-tetrahydrodipicolinate synthase [Candidatus Eisenbacteria bacterium]MBU1947592.1 4-hydroxy-tetrahydrodipicolinate synthase [Candidatus Eisenbacteria bacterium]MBU2690295.1 4-hydroxy-tetrahydrodipicolinate synthase [Candidatus Eisenbacteria bacterium]